MKVARTAVPEANESVLMGLPTPYELIKCSVMCLCVCFYVCVCVSSRKSGYWKEVMCEVVLCICI